MRAFICLCTVLIFSCSSQQSDEWTGPQLIQKSIQFHDPAGNWAEFKGTLEIEDSLPADRPSRKYAVSFDNELSKVIYRKDDLHFIVWNDSVQVFEGEIAQDRAIMLRNYYSYLWGLPMKLQDPNTIIEKEIKTEVLNGVYYWVVRVPYEKDVWYFYLDKESFEMKAYKFYQDEAAQKGEIIYLDGLLEVSDMKIPKERTWYRTEKDEFLGTDILMKASEGA
ncbi:DUF6503 family protein [uncultured Algoriphagus sp.]|uniref:DUF6503 family protein n=1 Tax=uncultured Algoriphagus sp. TaxID=417365 RepID=UPI0025832E59|nr:DUF6503 family protein [uncultured Algoriphagus sp.]